MGQRFFEDKIGALSEAGGTITLAPSRLTIGGQQYSTGSLNVAPSLSADTRYYIYAVLSSGTPQLIVSTNDNDAGPAGYDSWKLVGVFRTDEIGSFYAFASISSLGEILIESGKTSNGMYEKFSNGLLINKVPEFLIKPAADSSSGNKSAIWTFPIPFIDTNYIVNHNVQTSVPSNRGTTSHGPGGDITTTSVVLRYNEVTGTAADITTRAEAIGRWK